MNPSSNTEILRSIKKIATKNIIEYYFTLMHALPDERWIIIPRVIIGNKKAIVRNGK